MDARNKFLDRAIGVYEVSSPAVSAHLAYERFQASHDSPQGNQRNPFCGACGTPSISGWTHKRTILAPARRKPSLSSTSSEKRQEHVRAPLEIIDLCRRCGRKTRAKVDRAPRPDSSIPRRHTLQVASQAPIPDARKPARARKISTAKSLVARMKADESRKASSSQSFGFADFFKA